MLIDTLNILSREMSENTFSSPIKIGFHFWSMTREKGKTTEVFRLFYCCQTRADCGPTYDSDCFSYEGELVSQAETFVYVWE